MAHRFIVKAHRFVVGAHGFGFRIQEVASERYKRTHTLLSSLYFIKYK